MIGGAGNKRVGHGGTKANTLPYQALLLGSKLPADIFGCTGRKHSGCYQIYRVSYLHIYLVFIWNKVGSNITYRTTIIPAILNMRVGGLRFEEYTARDGYIEYLRIPSCI